MMKKTLLILSCLVFSSCIFDSKYKVMDDTVNLEVPGFKDFIYDKRLKKLEGADAKSFKIIRNGAFAKDKNHVYFKNEVIQGADTNSFEALSDLMGKDKNSGYYKHDKLIDSDGKTFERVSKIYYSKDKNYAYYRNDRLPDADGNSFEVVDEKFDVSRDKNYYYHHSTKLEIRDYESFTQLTEHFWKDKYHVYYIYKSPGDIIMEGVDAKTAVAVHRIRIKDKYGCHDGYERVPCD